MTNFFFFKLKKKKKKSPKLVRITLEKLHNDIISLNCPWTHYIPKKCHKTTLGKQWLAPTLCIGAKRARSGWSNKKIPHTGDTESLDRCGYKHQYFFAWKKEKKKKKKINPDQLLVFKALQVGPQMHQSTSQTPPTHGPSTGAISKNSLFLRLYKLVDKCTSPQVKHLPRMDNPCTQSRTIPCFYSSTSRSTCAPVH